MFTRKFFFFFLILGVLTGEMFWTSDIAFSAQTLVVMKDGRVIPGSIYPMRSVVELPGERKNDNKIERIIVIDDQLRRIYVPKNNIRDYMPDEVGASLEVFHIPQRINTNSKKEVGILGPYRTTIPFDEFGRRTLNIGGVSMIQGITEIAPTYIRVQGINYCNDMRISPMSLPRQTLTTLLKKQIDPNNLDERLRIYQFYVQAELFDQAEAELAEIINEFQNEEANQAQLDVGLRLIRQMAADRLTRELELRESAGQFKKIERLLSSFSAESVSTEKAQGIRRLLQKYTDDYPQKRQEILTQLETLTESLENQELKEGVLPLLKEIKKELTPNTIERFATFALAMKDPSTGDEAKLAIGLSGWLAGNLGVDEKLELALSMYRVRKLIRRYLLENIPHQLDATWESIRAEEAATPERVARLLQVMQPPKSTPRADKKTPLYYELDVPSFIEGETFQYCVQLPPEYDPNRKYPTIITLHGEMTNASVQLDWWCGSWIDKTDEQGVPYRERFGQATRYGYIVVAPKWAEPNMTYDYSAKSQAAILYSMRDAMRRFSIDTDRVFLSGHSEGGKAAWDLGISHPDLWAGVIPICGSAPRLLTLLKRNGEFVPFYCVGGELDGGSLANSSEILNWGMDKGEPYDITFVQYKGRGNEAFADETIRIFNWMQLRSRNFFFKTERTLYSIRPWDNFFWHVELFDFNPQFLLDPTYVNPSSPITLRPAKTEMFEIVGNDLKIKSNSNWGVVFLSPEIVDFNKKINVFFNTKKISPPNGVIEPSVRIMLEDARTRADRQHPFWACLNSYFPGKTNHWNHSAETP